MSLYPLVPLLSCIVCAVLAAVLYRRASGAAANRLAAGLLAGTAFWAFCETLWHTQQDAGAVLSLVRLSAFGWVWVGPLALSLFVEISGEPWPRMRAAARSGYLFSAASLAVSWFTPWMHTGVTRTSWGWGYELGPAYPLFYVFTSGCIIAAFWIGWLTVARSPAGGERVHARALSGAVVVPLLVASATDGLLPLAGVQWPRFGTASLALLGGVILWSFGRYGYSLLAPGSFADEILATLPEGVALLRLDGRVRSGNGSLARLLEARSDQLPGLRLSERISQELPAPGEGERECALESLGGRHRQVAVASTRLHDRRGSPIGLVVVVRDLTEVSVLRDRLLLSGRLAAVGELAAGIAHEINNPLAFVRANLSLLRQQWGGFEAEVDKLSLVPGGAAEALLAEGAELIDESLDGVDRASAIVRDVRGLAHAGRREHQAADLNALIEGVLRMAGPQIRGRAALERDLGELPPVWCAPQELQQVFLNLVLNAVQAIDGTGRIRVTTRCQDERVVVTIEDDGCGIDPSIRERIFDPFFTTKAVGEGTGLGLGIAYGIVHQHGGDIFVDSEPGRGTRFYVHLPAATDTIEAA